MRALGFEPRKEEIKKMVSEVNIYFGFGGEFNYIYVVSEVNKVIFLVSEVNLYLTHNRWTKTTLAD